MRTLGIITPRPQRPPIFDPFLRPHFMRISRQVFQQRLHLAEADPRRIYRVGNVWFLCHSIAISAC
jgi:hypothetical protein